MMILAIECSAKAASAAIGLDGELYAQYFQNNGQTHSRSIMPMIRDMFACCGKKLEDVDAIAVSVGPGSFTGLRIGIAAAKGLAWAGDKPCIAVSTLEAMAAQIAFAEGIICCGMDARRGQIYNALFESEGGKPQRLTPDRAISLEELGNELKDEKKSIITIGDGASLCYNHLKDNGLDVFKAPQNLIMQSAEGVLLAAQRLFEEGKTISCGELEPNYLRLSQAERERLEKIQGAGKF